MKKKLATLILVCTMLFAYGAINAAAATEGVYTYSVSGEEAKITKCSTSVSGELVIPNTLGGYPVTSIGSSAFYGCSSLQEIHIPEGVTAIGNRAFYNCRRLKKIIIPESITEISKTAFDKWSIVQNITNKNGMIIWKNKLLDYNVNATKVTIPEDVRRLESRHLMAVAI